MCLFLYYCKFCICKGEKYDLRKGGGYRFRRKIYTPGTMWAAAWYLPVEAPRLDQENEGEDILANPSWSYNKSLVILGHTYSHFPDKTAVNNDEND